MQVTVTRTPPSWTKGRRIGFGLAVGLTLAALVAYPPVLLGPIAAWLDGAILDGLYGETGLEIHRTHVEGATLLFWLTIVALVAQFRAPVTKPAPVWAAAAGWVVFLPLAIASTRDPTFIVITALVMLVLALHPGRKIRAGLSFRSRPLWVAMAATAPGLVYTYSEIDRQLTGVSGDPHVDAAHYAFMAALTVGLVVSALLGASTAGGNRVSAWSAGVGSVALGAFFIAHPGYASSVPVGWGVGLVVWAVVYLTAVRLAAAKEAAEPNRAINATA